MLEQEFKILPLEEVKKLSPKERAAYIKNKNVYEAQQGLAGATGSSSAILTNPTADKNGNEVIDKVKKSKARKKRKETPARWETSVSSEVDKKVRARVAAIKDEGFKTFSRNKLVAEALTYFLSNVPLNVHIEQLEEALEDECA